MPTDTLTQARLLKTYWKLKPDLATEVSCGELILIFPNFYFWMYCTAFFFELLDTRYPSK